MKNATCFFLLLFFLSTATFSFAQKDKIKFGKIDMSDMEMTSYEADPDANAVVLYNSGRSYFQFDNISDRGFVLYFENHVRIKILKETGLQWADFSIGLYKNKKYEEKLKNVKAITYNLEGKEIAEYKLDPKDIFEDLESENWINAKFALPNVKVGSVIELKYEVESDFISSLRSWSFQQEIPSIWSEYIIEVPEFFNYNKKMRGYQTDKLTINETSDKSDKIIFSGINRTGNHVIQNKSYSGSVDYRVSINRWVTENMPAFKEEVYMLNTTDYLTGIDFELASTRSFNNIYTEYTTTWGELKEELYGYESFGGQLKKSAWVKDKVEALTASASTPKEKAALIYEYVCKSMTWDGRNRILASANLKKRFEEGKGSSADINLVLVQMLQEAGLDCGSVLLSTRKHGRLNIVYPSLNDFNYVIAGVKIGEEVLLLDATEDWLPFATLPTRCLNDKGRWMSENINDWVDLDPGKGKEETVQLEVNMGEELQLVGKLQSIYKSHAAYFFRENMGQADSEDKYYETWAKEIEGLEVLSHKVEALEEVNEPIKQEVEITLNGKIEQSDDLIFFTPLLFLADLENPFKQPTRIYPVSFPYPINERMIVKFAIPEGYVLEEVPEKAVVVLPDNGGKFIYSVSQVNDMVLVSSTFQLNQLLFLSEDYPLLKQFYDMMIEKQTEQVVLKKKS